MTGAQRLTPLVMTPLVVVVDQISKFAIDKYVSAFDNLVVIPNLFSIVHTQNRGAAFSMLADASDAWRGVFLIGISSAVMLSPLAESATEPFQVRPLTLAWASARNPGKSFHEARAASAS